MILRVRVRVTAFAPTPLGEGAQHRSVERIVCAMLTRGRDTKHAARSTFH